MRLIGVLSALTVLGCGTEAPVLDFSPDAGSSEPICAPGTQTCGADALLVCQADGLAFVAVPCESGCIDNACVTFDCPPLSKRCLDAAIAEVCDAQGVANLTACTHGCLNGECTDIVCTAGLAFCDPGGGKVQKCAIDGLTIVEVETCPYGCDGPSATCLAPACDDGQLRCSTTTTNLVEYCNDGRTGFLSTGVTCEEECIDGKCYVSACTSGQQRCGVDGVEICNSAGTAYHLSQACQWGCLSNGAQALCATCPPGASGCLDNAVVFCESPVIPWTLQKQCKEIDTCAGGECLKTLTLSGSPNATSTLVSLTEALAACWLQMQSQDKKDDVCRSLHTTGLDDHIDRTELMAWFCDNAEETITAKDFSETDQFAAANEVMGCGLLSFNNLTVDTPGEKIHAGISEVECIGHEKNEVIVAPCETFGN
ncbi:MAG: hypothetical protein ACI9WU_005097 [Myxococcota bacterium]|jgi:hypothetical protein